MSGVETRREAGLECCSNFLIHCPSLTCFLAGGKGEKEAGEGEKELFRGSLNHWKQLKLPKKKMNKNFPWIQAFLRGGSSRKFHFENGMTAGLVQFGKMNDGGWRWKGLGTLEPKNAIYLQIILLRCRRGFHRGGGWGVEGLVQGWSALWSSLLFQLPATPLLNSCLHNELLESCHWISYFVYPALSTCLAPNNALSLCSVHICWVNLYKILCCWKRLRGSFCAVISGSGHQVVPS